MKLAALILPIALATATLSMPAAQAKDLTTQFGNGSITLSFGSDDRHHGGKHWGGKRYNHRTMSPRQISRSLYKRGYRDIRSMYTTGRTYTVIAKSRRGDLHRLTVSARDGDILDRDLLRKARRFDDRRGNRGHGDHHRNWN